MVAMSADPRKDQNRVKSGFHSRDDVRIHPVADHDSLIRMAAEQFESGAHHQRVRLADEISRFSGGEFDGGAEGAAGGSDAVLNRSREVGIGADQLGAGPHQRDRLEDVFIVVVAPLSDHNIVGIDIVHRDADIIEGVEEARRADGVGGASGGLAAQKFRGCKGAGIEVAFIHLEAHPGKLLLKLKRAALARIGQKQEALSFGVKPSLRSP